MFIPLKGAFLGSKYLINANDIKHIEGSTFRTIITFKNGDMIDVEEEYEEVLNMIDDSGLFIYGR